MSKSHKKAIAGSYLIPVLEYVDCHAILDSQALLQSLGLRRSQLDSSRFFLSREQYIAFMTPVLEKCNVNDLSHYLISNQNISQHGLLGLLALCSFNVRQIVTMVIRFYKLRSHLVEIEFIEKNDEAIIRITPAYSLGVTEDFTVELALATMHTIKQQILNSPCELDRIHINHQKHSQTHYLEDIASFNQPYNELIFPASELEQKLKSTHKPTFDMLEAQCSTLLEEDVIDVTSRIRSLIKESAEHFPTLSEAADKLATSPRTLSRKLKSGGKTYQQILDEERVARAKQLLLDTDLSVTEIAMYLHFTDSSHLTKLFKHYTKQTPLKYRQSQES